VTEAFDDAADSYDRQFTEGELAQELRGAVWQELDHVFRPGDRVLELGCGTGEDAVWLARRGVRVLATDVSSRMLELTRMKAAAAGVEKLVSTRRLDIRRLADGGLEHEEGAFDGALSNFGALNCVRDRRPVARALAPAIRVGGQLVLVVMGPLCLWEIGWHLAHGEPGIALRRFRAGARATVSPGRSLPVWYPTPRLAAREFAPAFRRRATVAIGCLLPPPSLEHLSRSRPGLVARLARLERRWHRRFPLTWLGDHFLLRFERCP
jgi:SAM-dependent methyltransferase